jgi:hypothetical protein
MRHVMLFVGLIVLVVAMAAAQAGVVSPRRSASAQRETKFKVRIENTSNPDGYAASNGMKWPFALSPGLFVVDTEGISLFTEGQKASGNGLESQAEDGNPSALVNSLESSHHSSRLHGVFNMPVGAGAPGPIGPGGAYEFTLTAQPAMKLTLLMMFGQSNDLFYAPAKPIELFNAKGAPLSGDITSRFMLYDAGTEADQEPGIGSDQAPRQKAPNTGANENSVVRLAEQQAFYTKTVELFRITITPEGGSQKP